MKKGLVFATIACTFALGLVACKKAPAESHTVSITNKDSFTDGIWTDQFDFSVSVSVSDVITADAFLSGDLVVTSSNTSVLTITGNNRLTPVAAGASTVKAIYKNNEAWSDSVDIVVKQRPTQRIVLQPEEDVEYRIGMVNSSGQVWASGDKTGYYLEVKSGLDNACKAKVVTKADATDDYKYSIELETPEDGYKAIGFVINDSHYNIGFEGEQIEDSGTTYTLAKAYFKVGSNGELSIKQDTTELFMGTYGTYTNSLSWRTNDPTDPKKIEYFAHIYEEGDPIPATAISVTPTELALDKGGNATIGYTLTPFNSTDKVVFLSLDTEIATVTDKGVVTGVAQGETTITVSANSNVFVNVPVTVSGTAKHGTSADDPLTVKEAVAIAEGPADETVYYVQGVVSEIVSAYSSQYGNMTFNVTNSDGDLFQFYKTACTSTQATDVVLGARVLGHGQITRYGSTNEFKWVQDSVESTLDTVAIPSEVSLILISGDTQLVVGTPSTLTATTYPQGVAGTVSWVSSQTSNVTVSDSGELSPIAEGSSVITASCGNASATVTVNVTAAAIHGTTVDDPLNADEAYTIGQAVSGNNVETELTYYVKGVISVVNSLSESNKNVEVTLQTTDSSKVFKIYRLPLGDNYATLVSNFVLGAEVVVKSVLTKYNATSETPQNKGEFISADLTGVRIVKIEGSATVVKENTTTLTAVTYPTASQPVAWSVEDDTIATVDPVSGVVTGVAAGTTKVYAAYSPTVKAEFTIEVLAEAEVTLVTVNSANLRGYTGSTDVAYGAGTQAVSGVTFQFQQIAAYKNKNGALQTRNSSGNQTKLWNTTAFSQNVKKVKFTASSYQTNANNNAWTVEFAAESDFSDATSVNVNSVAGPADYVVSTTRTDAVYIRITHILGYTMYTDAIAFIH